MKRNGIKKARVRSKRFALRVEAGWDILKDGFANYYKNGALNQAAAIALYALLSIIPLFVLSVLAASRFLGANRDIQTEITGVLRTFHPYFTGDLLAQLGQVEDKTHLLGWIGFVSLIWFSSLIFGAMETALNIAFRAESHRNFFVSKLLAISMIPLGWVVGLSSVLLTYVTTLLSSQMPFTEGHLLDLHLVIRFILQFVVPFLASVSFVTVVFKVIPFRKIPFRTALAGSCLFTVLTEMVKHPFTWYVAHHTRYHAIFGSLEAVVILVIWVYYMALIFLFCAELMSSYERRDMLLIERMLLNMKSRTGRQRLFRKFGRGFPGGSVICHEGDLSQEMYFLLSGKVRLEMKAGLATKTLAELGPGDHFGEMAALTGSPRAATAIALSDCDIAVVDGKVFHQLLRESDDLSIHLLKEFSGRIRNTNAALDELSQSWIRLVVLILLIQGGAPIPEQDPIPALAKSTGEDPADLRDVLRDLASEGVLELKEDRISRLDTDRAWGLVHRLVERKATAAATP